MRVKVGNGCQAGDHINNLSYKIRKLTSDGLEIVLFKINCAPPHLMRKITLNNTVLDI